jgi:hypothetical protein
MITVLPIRYGIWQAPIVGRTCRSRDIFNKTLLESPVLYSMGRPKRRQLVAGLIRIRCQL